MMDIEVKVLDQYTRVMFTAKLSDSWVHILTMRDQVKPYIKKVTPVAPGAGNGGDNNEYDVVYDGYFVAWEHFAAVGNEAN
jgi:hypothetical protein